MTACDQIPQQIMQGSSFPSFSPPAHRRDVTYWLTHMQKCTMMCTLGSEERGEVGRRDKSKRAKPAVRTPAFLTHIILLLLPPPFPTSIRAESTTVSYIPTVLFPLEDCFPGCLGVCWACCTLTQIVSVDAGVESGVGDREVKALQVSRNMKNMDSGCRPVFG